MENHGHNSCWVHVATIEPFASTSSQRPGCLPTALTNSSSWFPNIWNDLRNSFRHTVTPYPPALTETSSLQQRLLTPVISVCPISDLIKIDTNFTVQSCLRRHRRDKKNSEGLFLLTDWKQSIQHNVTLSSSTVKRYKTQTWQNETRDFYLLWCIIY